MTKKYKDKAIEYEKKGLFDRDLNEHRYDNAVDIEGNYNYLPKKFGERLRRFFLIPAVRFFGGIYCRFAYGLKVEGKKNLRAVKGGAISVCNHVHEMDTLLVKLALGGFRTFHTGSYYLLKKGWAGRIFKSGGFLPVGQTVKDLQNLTNAVETLLAKGKIVNFYPEHALWFRYEKVRPFKLGAFRFAAKAGVPVIPVFIEFRETRIRKKLKMQKKVALHILPAVMPQGEGPIRVRAEKLGERVYEAMKGEYERVYQKPMVYLTESDPVLPECDAAEAEPAAG